MKRFKKILYVLDEDISIGPRSADKVATLARLNHAAVTIMIASESSLFNDLSLRISGRHEEIKDEIHRQNCRELDQFKDHKRWNGIEIRPDYEIENDFLAIIKRVVREEYDLVIKEDILEQGINQLSMKLVRKCPCPVWIIEKGSDDFRRVLAAVDVGAGHQETAALNKKIIELTHSLAQRERGEAHYLHSWRLEYEAMMSSPRLNVSAAEISEMKQVLFKERQEKLLHLLDSNQLSYVDEQVHLREGVSEEVIKQVISELNIDVVVMGSVGRSGIPGLLIGNKAEKLLSEIHCTVLTVKPDGFVSPVTLG